MNDLLITGYCPSHHQHESAQLGPQKQRQPRIPNRTSQRQPIAQKISFHHMHDSKHNTCPYFGDFRGFFLKAPKFGVHITQNTTAV